MTFMLLKLAFLFRSFINYSVYTDPYSASICKKYGFSSGVRFTMRCHFVEHTELAFTLYMIFSVVILSYLTRVYELPILI